MIDLALSILALIAGGLTLELFGTALPPARHQEVQAFSLGTEGHEFLDEFQGNPS
jgi:hypothetical protein